MLLLSTHDGLIEQERDRELLGTTLSPADQSMTNFPCDLRPTECHSRVAERTYYYMDQSQFFNVCVSIFFFSCRKLWLIVFLSILVSISTITIIFTENNYLFTIDVIMRLCTRKQPLRSPHTIASNCNAHKSPGMQWYLFYYYYYYYSLCHCQTEPSQLANMENLTRKYDCRPCTRLSPSIARTTITLSAQLL